MLSLFHGNCRALRFTGDCLSAVFIQNHQMTLYGMMTSYSTITTTTIIAQKPNSFTIFNCTFTGRELCLRRPLEMSSFQVILIDLIGVFKILFIGFF